MNYFEAILLGLVEGFTEFLPISSTGHLILASSLLGIEQTEFVKTFEIAIQLGAILAVIITYWHTLIRVDIIKKLIVGFIPTGIIGFTIYPFAKEYLIGNEMVVVYSLILGGVALIVFEYFHRDSVQEGGVEAITYKQSMLIGLFQSIAIIPGVSRSAATIIGGLSMGLSRRTVIEFSFLLAVPTMLAATGYDLLKTAGSFTQDDFGILATGFVAAFVVALISIKLLLGFIRRYSFTTFGIYRIVIAILFLFWAI